MKDVPPETGVVGGPAIGTRNAADRRDRRVEPAELTRWLDGHRSRIAEIWTAEILRRFPPRGEDDREVLREFHSLLVLLFRHSVGRWREPVEGLWCQAAELYGSIGVRRGLAAGEVIEEFQFLRESLIRLLYADPPGGGRARVTLREILRINRFMDRGVVHASVGHTDALFFAHFQGAGMRDRLSDDFLSEVRIQLDQIRGEFLALGVPDPTREVEAGDDGEDGEEG